MSSARAITTDEDAGRKPAPRPLARLVILLGLFLGCTALGAWWARPEWRELSATWEHFLGLPTWTHLTLVGLALGLIAAEMLRVVIMGRALGARVGFSAALDATIANNFFSWITPGSALGEPAATYMLGRHGVPWDAAVLIAFGKFAISFAFIFGLGFLLVALGMGPPIPAWVLVPIAGAVGSFALLLLILVVGAFWPDNTIALLDRVERRLTRARLLGGPRATRFVQTVGRTSRDAVQRLGRFRQAGLAHWLAILATQVLYHAVFIAVLLVLAAAFDTESMAETLPIAIIYQGFLYLAPTPGSSGIGEASAQAFFGEVLPGGAAFTVVILFRAATYYLHVVIGLIYLPLVGGLREVLAGHGRQGPGSV